MVTDIATALDSSLDVCSILRSKFSEYQVRKHLHHESCLDMECIELFVESLNEKERELQHHRRQADLMHVKIRSAATLVIFRYCMVQTEFDGFLVNEYP